MGSSRTFVGFSSTDIKSYRLMLAWKAHEHIDFDFYDCQLQSEIRSEDETYIKSKCRARLQMAGTFVQLIGADTRHKHKYVRWEAEVALEKKCRIIGVNLDGWRRINPDTCPPILRNVGVLFVPFSPRVVDYALEHGSRSESQDWEFSDEIYAHLGYMLRGNRAELPTRSFFFR
ncbi:MAG: TIR domain-containing protein [Candidatus Obscuribacterales bacterium]|nr:TIR domain-containing protein [Candidatus Obscuribacterales bacterium]